MVFKHFKAFSSSTVDASLAVPLIVHQIAAAAATPIAFYTPYPALHSANEPPQPANRRASRALVHETKVKRCSIVINKF